MTRPPASADAALALIKPQVRLLTAYTLTAPPAARKLNQNESPFDAPDALKRAVAERMSALPWNRYPAFEPPELLARLAERHGWTADGVLVGNGSNELIQATLAVTVGDGTPVITPVPTFALYRLLAVVDGGRYVGVPFGPGFVFDVDALVAAARETQATVIVVNSPNNPTGSVLPEDGVARLLGETHALVVVDEAYQDFGGPSAVPLLAAQPRLVVLRTFSKAMCLAGLRFGYALAHPAVAREIAKAKLPYNVNAITLAAALAALDHRDVFERQVGVVRRARDLLIERLKAVPGITTYPSAANFVLIRCDTRPAGDVFRLLVEHHGILVRDVSATPGLEGCLRITAGTDDDVNAVVGALRVVLA